MSTVTTSTLPAKRVSVSDYLDRDEAAHRPIEYIGGELREMTGASREHAALGFCIGGLLFRDLDATRFEAYCNDMRVRIDFAGPYYYPDVVVASFPSQIVRDRGDTLLNPIVVFEILSPSTESIDRGEKLSGYANISTLVDYVIVSQDERRIDHYSRQSDGSWRLVILDMPSATLSLSSISVELPLAEIYDRVLPAQPET